VGLTHYRLGDMEKAARTRPLPPLRPSPRRPRRPRPGGRSSDPSLRPGAPTKLSDNDNSYPYGGGVRVGYLGELSALREATSP